MKETLILGLLDAEKKSKLTMTIINNKGLLGLISYFFIRKVVGKEDILALSVC